MADETQTIVTHDGALHYDVTLTGISDGTGEFDSTKVDIGNLTMAAAKAGDSDITPGTLVVERIEWAIQGYTSIRLYWDTGEDNYIATLTPGEGYLDWCKSGGLKDPAAGQDNGNINLTTNGHASGDTYTIRLYLRKKA